MSEELKPCPFCGGDAEFERFGDHRQSCVIICTNCGCRLETSETGDANGDRWNIRAALAPAESGWLVMPGKYGITIQSPDRSMMTEIPDPASGYFGSDKALWAFLQDYMRAPAGSGEGAIVFSDSAEEIEARLEAYDHLNCPICGGSGHIDDTDPTAAMVGSMVEPVLYLCPADCWCVWRDNKNGTISMAAPCSEPCPVCENSSLAEMIPLYLGKPEMDGARETRLWAARTICSQQAEQVSALTQQLAEAIEREKVAGARALREFVSRNYDAPGAPDGQWWFNRMLSEAARLESDTQGEE